MDPETKTLEEWVAEAEKLAAENGGRLPHPFTLPEGMNQIILANHEAFVHIRRCLVFKKIPDRAWLEARGYHGVMKRLGMI